MFYSLDAPVRTRFPAAFNAADARERRPSSEGAARPREIRGIS
jgi:hypothetical protein